MAVRPRQSRTNQGGLAKVQRVAEAEHAVCHEREPSLRLLKLHQDRAGVLFDNRTSKHSGQQEQKFVTAQRIILCTENAVCDENSFSIDIGLLCSVFFFTRITERDIWKNRRK